MMREYKMSKPNHQIKNRSCMKHKNIINNNLTNSENNPTNERNRLPITIS